MKFFKSLFLSLFLSSSFLFAHEGPWTAARPDGHAPISVMGDHMHAMGEWMVSYRYMTMDMKGLLKGSDSVSPAGAGFMNQDMLPKDMTMDMHMFGAMHAISDQWTLMCMLNYLDNEMTMQGASMGKMESKGLGDLKIGGLYDLARWEDGRRAHLSLGLSAPTGSIDEESGSKILGYGMQLGSGTWDFHPAITYLGQTENYSYGAQLGGVLRIGDNDQGYTLGNRVDVTVWGARKITDSLSASVKIDHTCQEEIDGSDPRLDARRMPMMGMSMDSPTFDPESQGRDLTSVGLGLNYYFQSGTLKGHRIAAEWETPLDQKVNGVQLELDSTWTVGWQYAW
ncbi:hypothetical protein N8988_08620 [Opitutales bacterium]|nr:hypothetical protein [Opitutales bacterium]